MTKISKEPIREIIDDFVKEIQQRKRKGPKPEKAVIDFRNEKRDGIQRDVYYVPIGLLRYRKDNGRISSDVLNYENDKGKLDERSKESQKIIEKFLLDKDKEKTEELTQSISHSGQREAAIITCDGFLINGNRRKMVLETLLEKTHDDKKYADMKVVILPGKDDEGGPPTLKEIEQIENRYQLQSEAKAEYYNFDRAISMRRKIALGMTLDEQLRDDPIYAGLVEKEFKKKVNEYEKEFLKPLECIDRYLIRLGRRELYGTISRGLGDPEGRWQAFLDYYKFVYQNLEDERKRIRLSVEEDEIGDIEDTAFKIIRKRDLKGLGKVHKVMRDLPKWIRNDDAKKELLTLVDIDLNLPKRDYIDSSGLEKDPRDIDIIWGKKHETEIIKRLTRAKNYFEHKKERERPIDLLEGALKKLYHENMDTAAVPISEIPDAMKLTRDIQERANELENALYHHQKDFKKLKKRL